MTRTITVDQATFNADDLTRFLQRGLTILAEEANYKEDFKALVEEASGATKIEKKIIRKFIKSRFAVKTKDIVAEAETLDALSKAVDD